jgi:hypothetical protein
MDELTKNKRGGFRPGSGRKPKPVEAAEFSILLETFDAEAERACIQAMIMAVKIDRSVAAFNSLMDRKHGRVTEKTESHHTIDVTRLSDDELERLAKGS